MNKNLSDFQGWFPPTAVSVQLPFIGRTTVSVQLPSIGRTPYNSRLWGGRDTCTTVLNLAQLGELKCRLDTDYGRTYWVKMHG